MGESILLVCDQSLDKGERGALKGLGCTTLEWSEAHNIRFADFEIVILDNRLSEVKPHEGLFLNMRSDIETLLEAGGVVCVLAGPTYEVKSWRTARGDTILETNYSFLPTYLQQKTKLEESESKTGSSYENAQKWKEYFLYVSQYWKIIYGAQKVGDELVIRYNDPSLGVYGLPVTEKVQPIAVTRATTQLVGCQLTWKGGIVVILPPPDKMYAATSFLVSQAREIYKQNAEEVREHARPPEWITAYKIKEQTDLEAEEAQHNDRLQKIKKRANELFLLPIQHGKDVGGAISKMFAEFNWEFDDLTAKAGPIDYIVHGVKGESDGLLIALTGSDGYIDANHRKVAQLFGALAEVRDEQRLVFLVNALANDDPNSRTYEKSLTEPALKRMGQHKICVLLVSDLYKMWVDFTRGQRSPDQIFQSIKETEGAFHYTSP